LKEDITTDLSELQNHLEGILERVHDNSLTLKRFQVFEMKLLNLNSLAEMIDQLLGDAKTFFDLDVISLCLIDEKGEIGGFLNDDDYDYKRKITENETVKVFGISAFVGEYVVLYFVYE
jgi:uncharacterized protein YigA (DUF484 family)